MFDMLTSPVPDFRSSTGLFKALKSEHKLKASGKQLFDASVYQTDSSTSSFHDMVRSLSGLVTAAQPTAFHKMLARLGREGRLMRLYTQNVDGIDVALPGLETSVPLSTKGPWPRSIQLHGGLQKMVCSKCHALSDFAPARFNGPEAPLCTACIHADNVRTHHAGKRSHGVGRLRPRLVLYNEHNPDEEAIGAAVAADLRARPDALIVVGTSMKIPGVRRIVREMCGVVRGRRDGLTAWINQDAPPLGKDFEDCWDLIVKGPCDEVARQAEIHHEHEHCSQSDVERAKERTDVHVVVASPKKPKAEAMPTPAPSPLPKHVEPAKPAVKLKLNQSKLTAESTVNKPDRKPGAKANRGTGGRKKKPTNPAESTKPMKAMLKTTKSATNLTIPIKSLQPPSLSHPKRAAEPQLPPHHHAYKSATSFRPPPPRSHGPRPSTPPPPPRSPLSSPVPHYLQSPTRIRNPHPQPPPQPLFPNLPSPRKAPPMPNASKPPPLPTSMFPNLTPRAAAALTLPPLDFRQTPKPDAIKEGRSVSPRTPPPPPLRSPSSSTRTPGRSVSRDSASDARAGTDATSPMRDSGTVSPASCPRGMERMID